MQTWENQVDEDIGETKEKKVGQLKDRHEQYGNGSLRGSKPWYVKKIQIVVLYDCYFSDVGLVDSNIQPNDVGEQV